MVFGRGLKLENMKVTIEDDRFRFIYEEKDEKRRKIAVGSIEMLRKGGSEEWDYDVVGKSVKIIYKPIQTTRTLKDVKKAFEEIMMI